MAIGPSSPNVVSVAIRLRDEGGEHQHGPIDPDKASGNIEVLVLSSQSFDASEINVLSIRFGPGQALPLSSMLVPATGELAGQGDEREDWERSRDKFGNDKDGNPTSQNLLLIFDLKSMAVQCVLDKALFLSGTTKSGDGIIGGVSSHLAGCNVRDPGSRR